MKKHHEVLLRLFKLLDSYEPQRPECYAYLEEVMDATYYPGHTILYEPEQVIKQFFFLASGTVIVYGYTEQGDKHVLHIYRQDEIIAGHSFTSQQPSSYYLQARAGAYMLHMTHAQYREMQRLFPETGELLARIRLSAMEQKELNLRQMLFQPSRQMAYAFYRAHPEFLAGKRDLPDADIASYLLISEKTLRSARNRLIREGRLTRPGR